MIKPNYQSFLLEEMPKLIMKIKADQKPLFGIMTPQHMIEHLIYVTKVTTRRYGSPDPKMENRQKGMKDFILSNQTFPKNVNPNKSSSELKPLKYDNLTIALDELVKAIVNFYDFYKENPEFTCYNTFMGELDFTLCERFHYKHYTHHLEQFGLIEKV